jgi:hypothetical protein
VNKQASAVMHRLGWPLERAKGVRSNSRPYHYVRPDAPPARASQTVSPPAPTQAETQPSEDEDENVPF